MIEASGAQALLRKGGWLILFRSTRKQNAGLRQAEHLQTEFGVTFESLDPLQLRCAEPPLSHSHSERYGGRTSL